LQNSFNLVAYMGQTKNDWVLVIGASDATRVKQDLQLSSSQPCRVEGTLSGALQTLRSEETLPSRLYILADAYGGLDQAIETYSAFCRSAAAGTSMIVSTLAKDGGSPSRPMMLRAPESQMRH
jgi:hypothetical protein